MNQIFYFVICLICFYSVRIYAKYLLCQMCVFILSLWLIMTKSQPYWRANTAWLSFVILLCKTSNNKMSTCIVLHQLHTSFVDLVPTFLEFLGEKSLTNI